MVTLGPLPQEQKVRWRIDRVSGASYKRTWFGTENQLKLIAQVERTFAESIDFDPGDGGKSTLVATYANQAGISDPEVARETQELDTEVLNQSLFHNETFQPLLPREQVLIRKVFENQESEADAMLILQAPQVIVDGQLEGGVWPGRLALAIRAYYLLVKGAESFENTTFSFTRTRTVSRRYPGVLNLDAVNTLWTTDELVAYTGNPLLFEVPSITLTPDEALNPVQLFPGWRMKLCKVTDVADGSRQMVEQWALAKWARDYYRLKPTT